MDRKTFHKLLIAAIKQTIDKNFFKATNDGVFLKKSPEHEGGFLFRYLQAGSWLTSLLSFDSNAIKDFIAEINPKHQPFTMFSAFNIAIRLWDSAPRPSMVDSGGHLIVPTTDQGADYKISWVCNYIKTEVCPWLISLKNMDIDLIDRINGFTMKNPPGRGFTYPFYICLYAARLHGIDFETLRSMVNENMSRDFKGDLELARSMLK